MSILNFKDKGTLDIANEITSKYSLKLLPKNLHPLAYDKLIFLDNADSLSDLMNWQGLRFEKLKGNRYGQYSIRINVQYRICFRWVGNNALDVEIVDYH